MPNFTWKDHRIFYRRQGDGPLLLILPGNTASSALHQGELTYFGDRYSAASLDFLGTGKSERIGVWPDDWWENAASQAAGLVKDLGYQECIVMGTSGGAVIALLMAIHYPQVVRAVIADSCIERFTAQMVEQNVLRDRSQRTADQVRFWESAHGADWEQVIEADTDLLVRFANRRGDWFGGRLTEIRCPVLLTASQQDSFLPDVSAQLDRMAAQITDCRVFINNQRDHPLMWSAPDDFRGVCDGFLRTLDG